MPKSIIDEIGNVTYSVTSQNQNQSLQTIIPFSVVDLDTKYSEITIPLTFDLDFANIRIIINSSDKNTFIELVDQDPTALKGAFNQAKNTFIELVDQASNLLKNDTNSSKLLNQLEEDVGNLINEFSNVLSIKYSQRD